jgi:hypothetical protein
MTQFASAAELAATGIRADALVGIDVDEFLIKATGIIASYIRDRYVLPIQVGGVPAVLEPENTHPVELTAAAIAIAVYNILGFRGFNPDQFDAVYKEQRDFYLGAPGMKGWLDKLSAGAVSIQADLLGASTGTAVAGAGTAVLGDLSRGWDSDALNQVGEPVGHFWNYGKPD